MLRSTLLVILFAFSATAIADDFSYSAITLSYGQTELDDFDVDGDSIGLGVNFEVGESFFVFGSYGTGELEDNLGNTLDSDTWNAGIGHHYAISESVDLVTQFSYEYIEFSALGISADDDGFGLGVGLRYAASEKIELNGGLKYVDLNDSGDDTSFGAGALYNFTDSFSMGLSGNWGDDVTSYSIGGRFYFGE
jgi:opacity protein-like surface antigen